MPLTNPLELCLSDERDWLTNLLKFAKSMKFEILIHTVELRIETIETKIQKLNEQ